MCASRTTQLVALSMNRFTAQVPNTDKPKQLRSCWRRQTLLRDIISDRNRIYNTCVPHHSISAIVASVPGSCYLLMWTNVRVVVYTNHKRMKHSLETNDAQKLSNSMHTQLIQTHNYVKALWKTRQWIQQQADPFGCCGLQNKDLGPGFSVKCRNNLSIVQRVTEFLVKGQEGHAGDTSCG